MATKWEFFQHGSKATQLLTLALRGAALVAAWAIWAPVGPKFLFLALVCVLAVGIVAGWIALWVVVLSRSNVSGMLASVRAAASAMWLVPGVLLLSSRSPVAEALGIAVVINSARELALSRAPKAALRAARLRAARESKALLFCVQTERPGYFSREALPTILVALLLYVAVYALAVRYPLLVAVSLAIATAIWVAVSVARGAMEARTAAQVLYPMPGTLLTLLLTVTLTAVLMRAEIVQYPLSAGPGASEMTDMSDMTKRVLHHLAHVPSMPVAPVKVQAGTPKTVVTRMVDPGPVIGTKKKNGISGVVLRSPPVRSQRAALIVPGATFRLSSTRPLEIPFSGEYHVFGTSSGKLPIGAMVETGTLLDSLYRTTSGGTMETIAVQTFEPPIDLTHCGKVSVRLTKAELMPVLASIQLVAQGGVVDGEIDFVGGEQERDATLEFKVPVTGRPLLVRAIRISFWRLVFHRDENVRIAVEGFTLEPRSGLW